MSRKLSKRAAAAAAAAEAANLVAMQAAMRLQQQEQARLDFFRRSLERNDVEIAALQDLHTSIQHCKRQLLRSCSNSCRNGNDDTVSPSHYYYHYYHDDDDDNNNNNKGEDCLLLLDLGQGKIRLSADKEGLEDASTAVAPAANDRNNIDINSINNINNITSKTTSLVSKLSPEQYHWSYDFLLRLQLRRQLLNRLVRRLQRMAVLMDATAASDVININGNNNNSNNNNNNKGDVALMAALAQPPLPPKYGDLRLHIDARALDEFQQHWQRQEQARLQIEWQREEKPLLLHAATKQNLDDDVAAAAAAVMVVKNPNHHETTALSSKDHGSAAVEEAAKTGSDAAAATATTTTTTTEDTMPGMLGAAAGDEMEVDTIKERTDDTTAAATSTAGTTTTTTTPTSHTGKIVDEPPSHNPAAAAAVDTVDAVQEQAAIDAATPVMAVETSTANISEQSDPAAADNAVESTVDKEPAAVNIAPPLVAAATAPSTTVAPDKENDKDDDEDMANPDVTDVTKVAAEDVELEIDYEAYREYMNAYEKLIHPITGQVKYTALLAEDDANPFAAASASAAVTPKGGKNKKKKNMPDFSAFTLPGIGATITHRTLSTQEKEVEYERWSSALLARIPQQPTLAELGLEHQVFFGQQRRRRAKQRQRELEEKHRQEAAAAMAAVAKKAAATAATTAAAAGALPLISPGKKLRNNLVEQDDSKMNEEEDNAAVTSTSALSTPPTVSRGKELRTMQAKDDDPEKDNEQEDVGSTKDNDDDDDTSRSDLFGENEDRMDVDVADKPDTEKEAMDEKHDFANAEDNIRDKQESKDDKQKKDLSSDEEEQSEEDDNEESQETKADEESDDSDSSSSKNAATSGEKPSGEEKQNEDSDDDDDNPPAILKKRPIVLAPTPSFYEQDLKRVRLVHAELVRSSMADFGRRKIKEATQEYNAALQVSSDLFAQQKQLYAQLHAFSAVAGNDVTKMQNQYDVELAVARAQWNRRRVEFEQKKLQRLMPERHNPQYRPDGTPMTKMYEMQPDPVRQIVASTVAHIVDAIDLIDTCRLQNDRFTEEFRPPPPNVESGALVSKNTKVEAAIRQEISNLGMQLRSTEDDRQRSWKRMLKTKTEYAGFFNSPITAAEGVSYSHPHYQQQPQHHHAPNTPLPNLHQSSRQSFPQEGAVASYSLPSFAPARAPRHPVRRPSSAPLSSMGPASHYSEAAAAVAAAAFAGSDSKYSAARVRERHANDGTVAPVTMPKKTKEGLYARPAGRTRKGMEWDSVRGVWVPAGEERSLLVPADEAGVSS